MYSLEIGLLKYHSKKCNIIGIEIKKVFLRSKFKSSRMISSISTFRINFYTFFFNTHSKLSKNALTAESEQYFEIKLLI